MLRFVTAFVTGKTLKKPNVHAVCYDVTGEMGGKPSNAECKRAEQRPPLESGVPEHQPLVHKSINPSRLVTACHVPCHGLDLQKSPSLLVCHDVTS